MNVKENILIISSVITHPVNMGNKSRIISLVKTLREMDFNIYYLLISKEKKLNKEMYDFWGDKLLGLDYIYKKKFISYINKVIRNIQIFLGLKNIKPFLADEWYGIGLDNYIKKLKKKIKFDVVFVEYIFFSKALECFNSDTLKIIDTHDVYSNREKVLLKEGIKHLGFFTTEQEESKALNRADVIIAIQDKEKEYFSGITNKKVITLGHITPIIKFDHTRKSTNNILFFGGNSLINQNGLKYFIEEVFPKVKSEINNAKFFIAGGIKYNNVKDNDIICLGEVFDPESLYKGVDIVINPVLTGTGQKIKSMEALGAGMPLVTTQAGAYGLEDGIDSAFLVGNSSSEMAEKISLILKNINLYNSLSIKAYEFIEKKNNQYLSTIAEIINL